MKKRLKVNIYTINRYVHYVTDSGTEYESEVVLRGTLKKCMAYLIRVPKADKFAYELKSARVVRHKASVLNVC